MNTYKKIEQKNKERRLVQKVIGAVFFGTVCVVGGVHTGFAAKAADEPVVDEYALDQVIVTATKTPVEAFKANANIDVITAEDIAKNHYTDIAEALRSVPGVTINQYAAAGYDKSNGIYINGSDGVVVLIDGVKMNVAASESSGSLLSSVKHLDDIERIEVMKGSASTLYGSNAKGGVINIITKKITKNRTTIGMAAGSYGKQKYVLTNEGYENGWGWRISYDKDKGNDFKDAHGATRNSMLDGNTVKFKLSKDIDTKSNITFNFNSYRESGLYGGFWENKYQSEINKQEGTLLYTTTFDKNTKNQFSFMHSDYNTVNGIGDPYGPYPVNVRTIRIADQFDKNFNNKHLLTAGYEYTQDTVYSMEDKKLTNRSYYLQDQWNLTKVLKLTGGIRYDSNSGFGSHTSPSVNVGYTFSNKANMYIGYSEYFITPTPYQLYNQYYGNQNLKPEAGNTKEIGFNYRFDKNTTASAHFFKRHSTDTVLFDQTIWKYTNTGEENAHGWDIQIKKNFNKNISSFVGYTHLDIDANAQYEKNRNGYLPSGEWNIGVDYTNKKFGASLTGRGVINRPGYSGYENFFPEKTYWVVDLGLNYKISQDTKVFFKVNNLLNRYYAEMSNVKYGLPDQWWTAPGRSFVTGVEFSF